jgi:hypothetical protein
MNQSAHRCGRMSQLALCASLAPLAAHADTDACTLVTAAQVSAAVHVAVGEGTHLVATFLKTCTWTPTATSSIKAVTVNVQTAAYYDGAKKVAMQTAAATPKAKVKPVSVGDDGYYLIEGEMVSLFFKKSSASAKVTVYGKMPVDELEAMEVALAKQVAAKM